MDNGMILLADDLKSWISGSQKDSRHKDGYLDQRYAAFLKKGDNGRFVFAVMQEIDGGWHHTGGQWYLGTLLQRETFQDVISIDFGQGWNVRGLAPALKASLNII